MWKRVKVALVGCDPVRVENAVEAGTPDVNCASGEWIELKWLREAPVKKDTVLTIDHYTPQQRCWAVRRTKAGGRVFLLLKVANEWLLFTGLTAAQKLGKLTLDDLRKVAIGRWVKKLEDNELRKLLQMDFSQLHQNFCLSGVEEIK